MVKSLLGKVRPGALWGSAARFALPGKQCLGVEFSEDEVRGALVKAVGKSREISEFVALKAADTRDDLPAIPQLQEIRRRLQCKVGTPAVFVTPMARVVVLSMNRERVRKMGAHALKEAARWEAEAYTGIPGHLSLSGVEVEKKEPEPGQIVEVVDEVLVHVAVLEQNVYRAAKERFRLAGLKLARVYPAEVCFHLPLLILHEESDRGVLEIGAASSGFALLRGGETLTINAMNITTETILEHLDGKRVPDLEDTLRFNFSQAPAPHPVAVTGSGAMDSRIMSFLQELSPTGVEPLLLRRTSGLTAAGETESPLFATAVGAAIRELGGRELRAIGISDALPASLRARQSIYLVPVAAASLLFVMLLSHNLLMRHQENQMREERQAIEAQLSDRREEQAAVDRVRSQLQETEREIDRLRRQVSYLRQDWEKSLQTTIAVYEGLAGAAPPSVALSSIRQNARSPERFAVDGTAGSASEALEFALKLQQNGLMQSVVVERLERQQGSGGRGGSHRFVMQLEVLPHGQEADQT